MKKSWFVGIITAICLLCLTGCREKFHVEEMQLFDKESLFEGEILSDWRLVGSQYDRGEPVQFWANMPTMDDEGNLRSSGALYRCSADGSREQINYVSYGDLLRGCWFHDEQGRFLILGSEDVREYMINEPAPFFKYETIKAICQLPDGRTMMLIKKGGVSGRVAELKLDAKKIEVIENVVFSEKDYDVIGAGKKGILLVSQEGIREVDLETGEAEILVPFTDTGYVWNEKLSAALQLCEDGTIEILWEDGKQEKMWYGKLKKDGISDRIKEWFSGFGKSAQSEQGLTEKSMEYREENKAGYEENEENREHYDIYVKETQFFDKQTPFAGKEADDWGLLGMQYDEQGNPVQLWAEKPFVDKDGNAVTVGNVYLYHADGSKEMVFQDIPRSYLDTGSWWRDKQGRYFILEWNGIRRLDEEGNEVFFNQTGENVSDICQLADGRIVVSLKEMGVSKLAELNPDTGELKAAENVIMGDLDNSRIGAGRKGVLLINNTGIREIDVETGEKELLLPFTGTTYVWNGLVAVDDFLLLEDGTVEMLREDGRQESLQLVQIDKEKTPIVVRGVSIDYWIREQIGRFNRENETYQVILEEFSSSGLDWNEYTEWLERTDMKLAVGEGADIICSNAVNDAYSLITKGAFEDLTPYMEQAGIKTREYFPLMTGWVRGDEIYGVNVIASLWGLKVRKEFTSKDESFTPDVLIDKMLANKGREVFMEGWDAVKVLDYFLRGSEDLWGTVDWENYTCDFNNEKFLKILEVAKRYGDTDTNGYPAIADWHNYVNFFTYRGAEELAGEGNVSIGYPFDDGFHRQAMPYMLAVNKNSACKEGAWELIAFLLSEEIQETNSAKENGSYFPVSRKAYEVLKEDAIATKPEKIGNSIRTWGEITEKQAEELTAEIEDARVLPVRTEPILDIVLEETQEYFSGIKTPEEVVGVIENRVQLFLDEIK